MKYCTCKEPKPVMNIACGNKFIVCAKSSGGCGKEIVETGGESGGSNIGFKTSKAVRQKVVMDEWSILMDGLHGY